MGSIGEEELVQMVRDYMESGSASTPNSLTSSRPPSQTALSILQDILLEAKDSEAEVHERVLMYVRSMGEHGSVKKWVMMRLQMDGYEASLCKTSWVSTFPHPKVFQFSDDYEYIDVMMVDKSGGGKAVTRLIVDMDFRSQFELKMPTRTYKELTNALPSVFVGTEERLNKIISLLCTAAKQSMKEKGLHVPPWRKAKYMQSKWLSKNCKKVPVVVPSTELLSPLGSGQNEEEKEGSTSTTCCPSIF